MTKIILFLALAAPIFGQCGRLVVNPATGKLDCAGVSGGSSLPAVTTATSSPQAVSAVGFYRNDSAGAMTFTLPTITSGTIGSRFCFRNAVTRTGAITLQAPASTYIDYGGVNGTAAGTIVSSGALGDGGCVVAVTTTQYVFYPGAGIWVNN